MILVYFFQPINSFINIKLQNIQPCPAERCNNFLSSGYFTLLLSFIGHVKYNLSVSVSTAFEICDKSHSQPPLLSLMYYVPIGAEWDQIRPTDPASKLETFEISVMLSPPSPSQLNVFDRLGNKSIR